MNVLRIFTFVVWTASTLWTSEGLSYTSSDVDESVSNKISIIAQMQEALGHSNQSARIYYSAYCTPSEVEHNTIPQIIRFPRVRTQHPARHHGGLLAVRELFRGDKGVVITQGPDKIIRLRLSSPVEDILRTKIPIVTFTHDQQYDARQAIGAILRSKEVVAMLKKLDVSPVLRMEDYISAYPQEGDPHLAPSLTNTTVDRALDEVAMTFGGIVVYGSCAALHVFDVEFF